MTVLRLRTSALVSMLAAMALLVLGLSAPPAAASEPSVSLGRAGGFAVLAGTTVTNTGPTGISGSLGVSPGSEAPGFPPGLVSNGSMHLADTEAAGAQADLVAAYNSAAGRATNGAITANLAGQTLVGGVYTGGALALDGTLTLDAKGVSDTVWIFQAASTLITGPGSRVALVNGADPCNVFWQVTSSATLDTTTDFVGTVLALTSITVNTGATVQGRLLARNGAVTLDSNQISVPSCGATTSSSSVPVEDSTSSTVEADEVTTTTDTTDTTETTDTTDTTDTTVDTTDTTVEADEVTTTVGTTDTTVGTTDTTVGTTDTTVGTTDTTVGTTDTTVGTTDTTVEADQITPTVDTTVDTTDITVQTERVGTTIHPTGTTVLGVSSPTAPITPGTPAPGSPGAPAVPATPVTEIPRTGSPLNITTAAGGFLLLLGAALLHRSRRPYSWNPPTL